MNDSNKPRAVALDLEALNKRHLRRRGTFFRMYAGATSTLKAFHRGIVYLDVRVDDRLSLPLETITRDIAESWRREKELHRATEYCPSIYRSPRRVGFVIAMDALEHPEGRLKSLVELANTQDVFIRFIEGSYR
jgi:hypothetical protein